VREQLEDVLGCEAACALIEQETLSDVQRKHLRAHTRACSDCATVERQARGRKGALRRIASGFGLPGFLKTLLGKVLVVAVTASAVGITGVAIAEPHATRLPDVAPLQVDRPELAPVAAPRHAVQHRLAAAAHHPALRRRPSAATQRHVTRAAAVTPAAASAPPVSAPAAEPTATPAAPAPKAAAAAPRPVLPISVPKLPVELAVPRLPVPELPPLPVPAPTVQTSPLPVELPVATPQVPGLPSVP
jgi:hypothetical protein